LSGNLSSALSVSEWGVNDANLSANMRSANVGSTLSVKWLLTSLGFWKILWELPWFLLFNKFYFQQTGRVFQNGAKNNFTWVLKGWLVFRCFVLVGFQRWFSFSDYQKFYYFTHNIFYVKKFKMTKKVKKEEKHINSFNILYVQQIISFKRTFKINKLFFKI